jgi:hypothetical protein
MINITNLGEITLKGALQERTFNFFIGFISNESRSIHALTQAHELCATKIMLWDTRESVDQIKLPRKNWLEKVEKIGVFFKDDKFEANSLECEIEHRIDNFGEPETPISILLDISSMPRSVMASVMAIMSDIAATRRIDMVVAYCLAKYTPPAEQKFANKTVQPVHANFTGLALNVGLPVAAIVGLGYEKDKALGAVEYIQSTDWWVFVPTSEETRYLKKVNEHNRTILKAVPEKHRFEYSIHSPLLTVSQLESLVSSLFSTHKPILLPFGPKIFFFCSLLVSMVHRNCSVWHVVGETATVKANVSLSANIMCLSFSLKDEII